MKVYESLRSPILSERNEMGPPSGYKSVELNTSASRTPINISIKIDTNQRNLDEESDIVKINNDDAIS